MIASPPRWSVPRRPPSWLGDDPDAWSWQELPALPPFQLADGSAPAAQQTRGRLCWDDLALHVRFDCEDRDAWGTYARRDDPVYEEEAVELFLAPGEADPVRYYEFEVSPLGTLFDAVILNPTSRRDGAGGRSRLGLPRPALAGGPRRRPPGLVGVALDPLGRALAGRRPAASTGASTAALAGQPLPHRAPAGRRGARIQRLVPHPHPAGRLPPAGPLRHPRARRPMSACRLSPAAASRLVVGPLRHRPAARPRPAPAQPGGGRPAQPARPRLAARRRRKWIAYGNPMSSGGKTPGGVTSLLVALPLWLWRDHRAASALVLVFHVAAYGLLDGMLKRILSPFERVLLAVFYWLNPWQLYFSRLPLEPQLSLPARRPPSRHRPGVARAGALRPLVPARRRAGAGVPDPRLVPAARRRLAAAGGAAARPAPLGGSRPRRAVAALPLIPWALEVMAHPAIVTAANKGFLGRGLLLVFPLARGLLYWLRYASLAVPNDMSDFKFTDFLAADPWLGPALRIVTRFGLALTIAVPLLANARLWRGGSAPAREAPPAVSPRAWLRNYARLCFVAAALVYSLSPTTIMMWQGLVLFHAAVLPVILWGGALGRGARGRPGDEGEPGATPPSRSSCSPRWRSAPPSTVAAATTARTASGSPCAPTTRCSASSTSSRPAPGR